MVAQDEFEVGAPPIAGLGQIEYGQGDLRRLRPLSTAATTNAADFTG